MSVRLGGGQGFYGDGVDPVADVLNSEVDYLVCGPHAWTLRLTRQA